MKEGAGWSADGQISTRAFHLYFTLFISFSCHSLIPHPLHPLRPLRPLHPLRRRRRRSSKDDIVNERILWVIGVSVSDSHHHQPSSRRVSRSPWQTRSHVRRLSRPYHPLVRLRPLCPYLPVTFVDLHYPSRLAWPLALLAVPFPSLNDMDRPLPRQPMQDIERLDLSVSALRCVKIMPLSRHQHVLEPATVSFTGRALHVYHSLIRQKKTTLGWTLQQATFSAGSLRLTV